MDVAPINALTASWATRMRGGAVQSGAGVWPLLAILAASADEPGRQELADAAGVPAEHGMEAARTVLDAMNSSDGVAAAFGLWVQEAAGVYPSWTAQLPTGTVGTLTGDPDVDKPVLDTWASERTGGLIDHCPVDVHPDLMLTLATALTLQTSWVDKFEDDALTPRRGPWAGQRLRGLRRTSRDLDALVTAETPAGPLTLTRVAGENGLDVHLVLGADNRGPGEVMPAAIRALTGEYPVRTGAELLDGAATENVPGVAVVPAQRPNLSVTTVRFTVRSEHDLLRDADLLGLTAVRQARGQFSRVAPVPLCVDQARQAAVAVFSAQGFVAAAVTAVGVRLVSAPLYRSRGLQVTYDRPFGFVAVHRATGLVLFTGWVTNPDPLP